MVVEDRARGIGIAPLLEPGQELERKLDAVTDWRGHFAARPFTVMSVAFAGPHGLSPEKPPRDQSRESLVNI